MRQRYHTVKQHHTQGQLEKATSCKARNKPVFLGTFCGSQARAAHHGSALSISAQLPCAVLWHSLLPHCSVLAS